jgi:hypothetical protein
MTLLVHPEWLRGSPRTAPSGASYGGAAQDDAASTTAWNKERASHLRLVEVRGELPEQLTCPETHVTFLTNRKGGNVPGRSSFQCAACGTKQDVQDSVKQSGKCGPWAAYAIQATSKAYAETGVPYGGRYFAPANIEQLRTYNAAVIEWEQRSRADLKDYWPKDEIPIGAEIGPHDVLGHHFSHWWTMFNPRQLLSLSLLLRSIMTVGKHSGDTREFVLGAFQQYLRNQNMFCFWNPARDSLEPFFSDNHFHPKSTAIENSVFSDVGRGTWTSCIEGLQETTDWSQAPWEILDLTSAQSSNNDVAELASEVKTKGLRLPIGDKLADASYFCESSTDLQNIPSASTDLVITDPPFGGLIQYAELADFFLVWLRIPLQRKYPSIFNSSQSPKSLEVVANSAREPDDPDGFYKRLLTSCWSEANRILKPGGLVAFTFHHSEDEPWVAVLEALFDAGFYLEATYPVRSDETKGEGDFGAQKIEYDIIHVCRKRLQEPTRVSWAKMRREVLQDVRQLQQVLEHHANEGLPAADLQVIRRGKALEYFSRHYGQVYVNDERQISVKEALVGINQLIDEEVGGDNEPAPGNAEPLTRQFLRIFDGKSEQNRDQVQKYLRGTGVAPDEYTDLGWCEEHDKVFRPVSPIQFAQAWHGRHRRNLVRDYDQAMVLIGACFENSGINAADTVKNENFAPRPSLKALLDWCTRRGNTAPIRTAAARAFAIYQGWERSNETKAKQLSLFEEA